MLNTGYISFITESGGGFDSNGNPLPSTDINSDYFPCSLQVVKKEYLTLVDGQYQQAAYSVIVDNFQIEAIRLTDFKSVQLQDPELNDLGVFQVHNKEFFPFTSKLKVIV